MRRYERSGHLHESTGLVGGAGPAARLCALFAARSHRVAATRTMTQQMSGDFSTELCGATHVAHVGDSSGFEISEGGVGARIRRIQAMTRQGTLDWVSPSEQTVQSLIILARVGSAENQDTVRRCMGRSRKSEPSPMSFKAKLASGPECDLSSAPVPANNVEVMARRVGAAASALVATPLQSPDEVILIARVIGARLRPSIGQTGQGQTRRKPREADRRRRGQAVR